MPGETAARDMGVLQATMAALDGRVARHEEADEQQFRGIRETLEEIRAGQMRIEIKLAENRANFRSANWLGQLAMHVLTIAISVAAAVRIVH